MLLVLITLFGCTNVDKRVYSFDEDKEGFEAIYADYEADAILQYEMIDGFERLPLTDKEAHGLYIGAKNCSADLFMGYVKEIDGLDANGMYRVNVQFTVMSNVDKDLVGIGGSPGTSVYVKAGFSTAKPEVEKMEDGYMRFVTIDAGNLNVDGIDVYVVGNLEKEEIVEGFVEKEFDLEMEVSSNRAGAMYLLIGTDSGFEGFSEYYISNVIVKLQKMLNFK